MFSLQILELGGRPSTRNCEKKDAIKIQKMVIALCNTA